MSYNLQNSFLSALGAVATAALFVGVSVAPAFNLSSSMVI